MLHYYYYYYYYHYYDLVLIFFSIPAFIADGAEVNPRGIKTILANGLITFFINENPVFSNGPSYLQRNPHDCIIIENCVFDNLILVDELFAKALRRIETCVLVSNNLRRKLFSLSPIIFDDNLKTNSVSFVIADFNLLSSEFHSFTFKLFYCVIFILVKIKLHFVFNEIAFTKLL